MKREAIKRICLLILLLLPLSLITMGQEKNRIFKRFKTDVSVGIALPQAKGEGAEGGILFAVEPKYGINDQLSVGLRMEGAMMARGVKLNDNATFYEGEGVAQGSYVATIDYYFNNNKFRPFAGAGLGAYEISVPYDPPVYPEELSEFRGGGMLRAGFETGHFRMGIEYNIVGATDFSEKNNYLSIKAGVCFGGGRFKQK
jgi:outer membrane protein X